VNVITLTTDFGTSDWFVGTMKGVMLKIHPRARIVDLTHEIAPGNIRAGAFALAASAPYFPNGTVHVAVVDPGVGGARRAIAIRTRRYVFIGPDNGVLSLAAANEEVRSVRVLQNEGLFLKHISRTFHGRDIFAPVAAHLSQGTGFRKLGARAGSYVQVDWPQPFVDADGVRGEVVYLDRFGNAITNIPADAVPAGDRVEVWMKRTQVGTLESSYESVPAGAPVAVVGSTGFVEVAVNTGSAARVLALKPGDPIRVRTGA
jgi:S-adenosylmethionine hydrolase